jgi:hypothetical protein
MCALFSQLSHSESIQALQKHDNCQIINCVGSMRENPQTE